MNSKKNILGEVAGVFSSNLATMIFGLGTGIILSRILGPEQKGIYTSLLVIPGIIASIATFGTRQSSIYHIGKKIFTNQQVISALFFLFLTSSVIGALLFFAYMFFFNKGSYTELMIILAISYTPIKLLITYSGSVFLANIQFRKANMLKWLTALLTLIIVFFTVFILRMSIIGALLALIAASCIVLIIAIISIIKDHGIHIHFDKKVINTLFRMGIIYAIALLIIQLNFRIDILILDFLSNKKEIGFYSIGVSIAEKLWQIPMAIGIVVISRSAVTTNMPELIKDVGKLLRLGFLIVFIASIAIFFIVPYAIPLLYGNAFDRSVIVVQHILPGIIFFVIVRILSSSLAGLGKPWLIILIFLPALFINVGLNFLWIPKYGCLGAVWATNVSYILGSIVLLFAFAHITKTKVSSFILFQREDFHILRNIKTIRKRKKELKKSFEGSDDDES
ncbi:MAG: oligosaccharide flippase family protein [Bacteroidetes bacterium]|nr:oligosaccharide flippase family protein [Bacteroidota bacterium]